MSGVKCKNCGSTDIEVDNARGDAVCTNCGSVLEDNIIVSEVQFEEAGHGSTAIGQFVSADSGGGATSYGYGKFQVGSGHESREVTIKKAKNGITHLCHQLQLNQHCIDTAVNFFKMALIRNLTRGRRTSHIYAACVYITCRTEGTSHLLIDISDVLQICSYELGRTYLKLSNVLCINIPSVDPCLYIMRFANRLQFGAKTHEVSMTALRIVQRMKKDSIHSGRRPTGLCGAALLIAARMHDYNRSINDVVGIVKIHESTLRKRLTEFAETPSSALTFDEFMSVDLEAEQDPPAFKAARIKDKERLMQLGELELTSLQRQIDEELEIQVKKITPKRYLKGFTKDDFEETEASAFIAESNMEAIGECLNDDETVDPIVRPKIEGLRPDLASMCTPSASELKNLSSENKTVENGESVGEELNLEDLDDEEIDGYIMTEQEARYKNEMWMKLNAEYLKEAKLKEERLAKEREEGKVGKKKRKPKKKQIGPSQTAGEAIEKMLQEKKISTKINYDILKSLNEPKVDGSAEIIVEGDVKPDTKSDIKPQTYTVGKPPPKRPKLEFGLPIGGGGDESGVDRKDGILMKSEPIVENGDEEEDYEEPEAEPEPEPEHHSLMDMLNNGEDDDYYGYEDEHY